MKDCIARQYGCGCPFGHCRADLGFDFDKEDEEDRKAAFVFLVACGITAVAAAAFAVTSVFLFFGGY